MAQKKTSYTNADLKRGEPGTEYGEWKTTGKPKDPKNELDRLLNEGRNIEDIMAEAQGTLTSANRYAYDRDKPANDAAADMAIRNAERTSTLGGQIAANPGRTMREGVMGAALPLSFAGGPVGAAAAVPLSIEALNSFADDPSILGGLGVAATAIPGARLLKAGAKEAQAIKDIRATYGAGDMGAAFSRQKPYSMGRSVQTPVDSPLPQQESMESILKRAEEFRPRGSHSSAPSASNTPANPRTSPPKGPVVSSHGRADQWNGRSYDMTMAGDAQSAASRSKARAMRAWAEKSKSDGGLRDAAEQQLAAEKARRLAAIENRPPEPIRTGSMSAFDEAGEAADREFMAANPARSRFSPEIQKVPRGVSGDEYADVRAQGGAFNKDLNTLTPEEAAAEDEFWTRIAQMFGR